MSLSSIIRAAAGGPKKTRAEGDQPEENLEDDVPVTDDDDSAEGDQPEEEDAAEDDQPDDEIVEDDDVDETMSAAQKTAYASGRKSGRSAERKRMAAILGNPAADTNPALAAHLAFSTGMDAASAISALKAGGAGGQGQRLAGRMAAANQPRLGGGSSSHAAAGTQPERIAAASAAIIEAKSAKASRR